MSAVAGLVDFVTAQAKVGGGRSIVPTGNIAHPIPAGTLDLAPILRCVVFIRQETNWTKYVLLLEVDEKRRGINPPRYLLNAFPRRQGERVHPPSFSQRVRERQSGDSFPAFFVVTFGRKVHLVVTCIAKCFGLLLAIALMIGLLRRVALLLLGAVFLVGGIFLRGAH